MLALLAGQLRAHSRDSKQIVRGKNSPSPVGIMGNKAFQPKTQHGGKEELSALIGKSGINAY